MGTVIVFAKIHELEGAVLLTIYLGRFMVVSA